MVRTLRQLLIVAGPAAASLAWLRFELAHPALASRGLVTSHGLLVSVGVSRLYLAYAAFLVASAMVPLLLAVEGVLSNRRREARRPALLIPLALLLALPCAVAGYTWEAARSGVTLTDDGIAYRRSAVQVEMPWSDISAARFSVRGGSQVFEVGHAGRSLRIDLSPFSMADRLMLLRRVPSLADLGVIRRTNEECIWRRQWPRIAPTSGPGDGRHRRGIGPDGSPDGPVVVPSSPR